MNGGFFPPGVCVQTRTHGERECEKAQFMIIYFFLLFSRATQTQFKHIKNDYK